MSEVEYTFAVAHIRGLEGRLFSQATIDQLMACRDYDAALDFIIDKGWGGLDVERDADAILAAERSKIWETIRSLSVPMETFDVLSYPNVFHNLKTAIKEVYTGQKNDDFFYEGTVPSREELRDIIARKDFSRLPGNMDAAAQDAFETIFHSNDGQLCDVIIDKACLEAIDKAGKESDSGAIRRYAETVVAVTDIKIAVRCQKTGKSIEFMRRALQPCGDVDTERLAKAATSGFEAILEYLSGGRFREAAEALRESPSAFERWCDNYLMEILRPEKYEVFSVGPLVAYVLARENEIKTVGIILSGKLNGLTDDSIRERIREMYV
ncbi:MAG: V-type ATPase subunit [Clostridiales bacterium]|nr:V-type ATPase subunit [Clostridiales bacterium]